MSFECCLIFKIFFGCVWSSLMHQFPLVVVRRLLIVVASLVEHGVQGAQALVAAAHGLSNCGFRALKHRLSSCGTWASLPCSRWDLLRSGIKCVSPALAGGFLTTEPPEKPWHLIFRPVSFSPVTQWHVQRALTVISHDGPVQLVLCFNVKVELFISSWNHLEVNFTVPNNQRLLGVFY